MGVVLLLTKRDGLNKISVIVILRNVDNSFG